MAVSPPRERCFPNASLAAGCRHPRRHHGRIRSDRRAARQRRRVSRSPQRRSDAAMTALPSRRLLQRPISPLSRRCARGENIGASSRPLCNPGCEYANTGPCRHNLAASLWTLPKISRTMFPVVASCGNRGKTRKIENSLRYDSIRRVRICGEASEMGAAKEKFFCMVRVPPWRDHSERANTMRQTFRDEAA